MSKTRNILVVGHSHIDAIREAAIKRRASPSDGHAAVRTIHVHDPSHGGEFAEGAAGQRFSAGLLDVMRYQIARHEPYLASAMCGNMHSALSLVNHSPPMDFPLSGEPSPKLNPDAVLRSEEEVRTWLAAAMQVDLDRLTLLRDAIGPFCQIESPPPVSARSYLAAHIEPYFTAKPEYLANGIAPGGIRYRMWRLSSRIMADHCRTIGCAYLSCPETTRDDMGFLDRRFAGNATHANGDYGEEVIRKLEASMAACSGLP